MNFNKFRKNNSGVTLMETIVALGILVLGISSSLALMTSSMAFSSFSEQQVVVVNLAREGIELIRSLRSSDGFSSLTNGDYVIEADESGNLSLTGVSLVEAGISGCDGCRLYFNNGHYNHVPSEEVSIYKRLISISDSDNGKKIISQVYWSERGRDHYFTLEAHLTDW
jgi:hypothetical protein